MKREKAIQYLKDKDEYCDEKEKTKEQKVQQVMKQGKIYGDPIAEIQW